MIAIVHSLWFYLHEKMHCAPKVKTSHLSAFEISLAPPQKEARREKGPFCSATSSYKDPPKAVPKRPMGGFSCASGPGPVGYVVVT